MLGTATFSPSDLQNTNVGIHADHGDFEDSFVLVMPSRKIITSGCFRRITTPAEDGEDYNGKFQTDVRKAFADARNAGIDNPIIVGAIPFDPSEPSALFIPTSYRSIDEEEILSAVDARTQIGQPLRSTPVPGHDKFISMVSEAVDEIKAGNLNKTVLSRLIDITTKHRVDSKALLAKLIKSNPDGYSFHVPLPDGGELIGSSPELLLSKRGSSFISQPLAGSAKRNPEHDQEVAQKLFESAKDRHEHKLVVDSVKKTLSPRCDKLDVPEAPSCITTPTLWHLATTVSGSVAEPERENSLSLACLLHPTPALSGFPHKTARDLLQRLEPFNRDYFGGIVGYSDSNGDGTWAIAIRCGKVLGDQVRIFAGAGIVSSSSPESEWRETQVKLTTMLQALGISDEN